MFIFNFLGVKNESSNASGKMENNQINFSKNNTAKYDD